MACTWFDSLQYQAQGSLQLHITIVVLHEEMGCFREKHTLLVPFSNSSIACEIIGEAMKMNTSGVIVLQVGEITITQAQAQSIPTRGKFSASQGCILQSSLYIATVLM